MKKIAIVLFAFVATNAALAQLKMDSTHGMGMSAKPAASAQKTHEAKGSIKKINSKTGYVMISHGPVNSLGWPPMTMSFKVKDRAMLDKLSVGQKIGFGFIQEGDDYVLTKLR